MWVLRTKFRSFAKAENAEPSLQPVHLLYTKLISCKVLKHTERDKTETMSLKLIHNLWEEQISETGRKASRQQDYKARAWRRAHSVPKQPEPHLPQAVVGCARLTGQRLWGKHLATVVEKADPGEAPEQ